MADLEARDPRRAGLAAIGASVGYTVGLFVPGSTPVRIAFGVAVLVLFVVACFVLPLPGWRDAPGRRVTARNLMIGEAALIVVIATAIAVAVR